MNFVKKHPEYNATVHTLGGLGLGFIIAYYFSGMNLLLWGIIFIVIALVGHAYMLLA